MSAEKASAAGCIRRVEGDGGEAASCGRRRMRRRDEGRGDASRTCQSAGVGFVLCSSLVGLELLDCEGISLVEDTIVISYYRYP